MANTPNEEARWTVGGEEQKRKRKKIEIYNKYK